MPPRRSNSLKSCANPKFASWIQEKYDELEEGSNIRFTYGKALRAIVDYPEYLPTPQAAVDKVNGVGPSIKKFLESKIREENGSGGFDFDMDDASSSSPKKRGRPKASASNESRPAKRVASTSGTGQVWNSSQVAASSSRSVPSELTPTPQLQFLFWYLDASNCRVATRDEGHITITNDQAVYTIELASFYDPTLIEALTNVRRVGDSTIADLSLNEADSLPVSTMPLEPRHASSSRTSTLSRRPTLSELLENDPESQRSKYPTLDPSRQADSLRNFSRGSSTQSFASTASLDEDFPDIRSLSRPSSSLSRTSSLPATNSTGVAGPSVPQRSAPLARSQTTGSNALAGPSNSQRPTPLARSQTTGSMGPPTAPPLRPSQGQNRVAKLSGRPRLSAAIPNLPATDVAFELDNYTGFEVTKFADFRPITIPAGTYDICFILDNRERDATISYRLGQKGIPVEQRALALGDVTWVAKRRFKDGSSLDEISLDVILERKRLDDLCNSIKDGRFHEQKFRLHHSGITRVFYVVEEYDSEKNRANFEQNIATALSSTQVVDGFMVRETKKLSHTVDYYAVLHRAVCQIYQDQDLHVIPQDLIKRYNYLPFQTYFRKAHPDRSYLTTYQSFEYLNSKSGFITVQTAFARMLLCIDGMSAEKVGWVIKEFTTFRSLYKFFVEKEIDEWKMREEERRNPPQLVGRQRKAKSKVEEARYALQDLGSGKRKIGPSLSEKVYKQLRAASYKPESDSDSD